MVLPEGQRVTRIFNNAVRSQSEERAGTLVVIRIEADNRGILTWRLAGRTSWSGRGVQPINDRSQSGLKSAL
jgi:hypothetical protein